MIVVAFGSNIGNRHGQIVDAANQVGTFLSSFRLSTIIETAPVGPGLENDPPYLNAVGLGESTLSPRRIFERLRAIEAAAGRTRPYPGAPRTLDLDQGANMFDLTSPKVTPGVHCANIRHKGMFVLSVSDPDEGKFYDAYDTGAYWCAETATGFGPDGQPVRPDACVSERRCCKR